MVRNTCKFLNNVVQNEIFINYPKNSFGGWTHAKIKILDSLYWQKHIKK